MCMLLCSLSAVLLTLPYITGGTVVYDVGSVYALVLAFTYTRIGFSYAQARLNHFRNEKLLFC